MIARLLISPSIKKRREEINKILALHFERASPLRHPDILYFPAGEKIGIAEARKIKEHFSLKPYSAKGRAIAIEDASVITHEAQNALLKTLEELPQEAILILGTSSESKLLPTIISRCEIIKITPTVDDTPLDHSKYIKDLERLLNSSIEERFEYIEKLKDREQFLHSMVHFFRQKMVKPATIARMEEVEFLKELLKAEEWVNQNVNIRAILEYLMLVMPPKM